MLPSRQLHPPGALIVTLALVDFSGPVLDGDTLEVLHDGIDCPEKGQAFAKRAKHAASGLVYGKEVTVTTSTSAPLPMCSCPMARS